MIAMNVERERARRPMKKWSDSVQRGVKQIDLIIVMSIKEQLVVLLPLTTINQVQGSRSNSPLQKKKLKYSLSCVLGA